MQVILNDLPTNNWARCVQNFILGDRAPAAPDNYVVSLAPKSFYSAMVGRAPPRSHPPPAAGRRGRWAVRRQVAPVGTVHLGVSICAMLWLSSPPAGSAKNGISHLDGAPAHRPRLARQAPGCAAASRACGRPAAKPSNWGHKRGRARARAGGAETRAAFKRQADADADTFLRLRAAEFAPGGLLFIVVPSRMGERSCTPAMYDPVAHAAAELARAGDIDASLLEDLVMPSYIYEVEARARRPCPSHPGTSVSTAGI